MPEARKRPCAIWRRWFPAEPASGTPTTCLREAGMPDVAPTENPSQLAPPEPRLRHRLADRPTRGADPIPARTVAVARAVETSSGRISLIRRDFPAHSPFRRERPVPAWAILNPQATMQLEFHQLDRRWEHLRVRRPHRQRRLMASLAESGQQTPIVVVLSPDHRDRYLVIDGHKRIAALQQLGRDTVEATVWAMSDAEALLLDHHDSGTERPGSEPTRDRADVGYLPSDGAQSRAIELHRGSGDSAGRESRTLPATDPGAFQHLQGESRASP